MEPIVSEIEGVRPHAAESATAVPDARPRQAGKSGASKARAGKAPSPSACAGAEGIYKDRHGLATTVKVNGVQREVRFRTARRSGPSAQSVTSCAPACGRSPPAAGTP